MLSRALLQTVFVLLSICSVLCQDDLTTQPQNISSVVTKNCHEFNPTCNGNGICTAEANCRCFTSYYGIPSDSEFRNILTYETCDKQFVRDIPGFRPLAVGLLAWTSVLYLIGLFLACYRLSIEFVYASASQSMSRIVTKYVLSLMILNSLVLFLNSLDYWGNFGVFNFKTNAVLDSMAHPLFLLTFCALFFHWVELYQKSTRSLKKAEMLKKIRSDYDATVSMEDILVNLSFLKKFKFFYMALSVASIGIFIAFKVVELTSSSLISFLVMHRVYDSYFALVWIGFCIAFLWYGIRLMKIMPESISNKIKEMTIMISIFSVSALASNLISIATLEVEYQTSQGIWVDYASNFCDMICIYSAIFMYIPIWEWHKYFNAKMIRSLLSTSRTSNQSTVSMDSVNSEKTNDHPPVTV